MKEGEGEILSRGEVKRSKEDWLSPPDELQVEGVGASVGGGDQPRKPCHLAEGVDPPRVVKTLVQGATRLALQDSVLLCTECEGLVGIREPLPFSLGDSHPQRCVDRRQHIENGDEDAWGRRADTYCPRKLRGEDLELRHRGKGGGFGEPVRRDPAPVLSIGPEREPDVPSLGVGGHQHLVQ